MDGAVCALPPPTGTSVILRASRLLTALAASAVLCDAQVVQQHASVIYDHRGGNSPRVHSQLGSVVTRGGLTQVRVPSGQAACFVVERANTLLYGYSLNAEALKGQTSADLTEAVSSLAAALSNIDPALHDAKKESIVEALRKTEKPEDVLSVLRSPRFSVWGDDLESLRRDLERRPPARSKTSTDQTAFLGFLQHLAEEESPTEVLSKDIASLASRVSDMEALRQQSRRDTSLSNTVARAKSLLDRIKDPTPSASTDIIEPTTLTLLQETRKSLITRAEKLVEEYSNAQLNDRLEFCHTLQDARVRMNLVIAPKTATGNGSAKADTVASFVAEPENEKNFEIVPAIVASFALSKEAAFEVEGNVIRAIEPGPKFAPSAFMMWRITDRRPWWAAVGTALGRTRLPDTHVGLVLRLGEEKLKTNLVLGAGLTFARASIGLNGATVGQALPDGKSLADVTRYGYRWGPTVFVTVSGLSLALWSQGVAAASPDAKAP